MKATKVSKYGFQCPDCQDVHHVEEMLDPRKAWELDTDPSNYDEPSNLITTNSTNMSYSLEEPRTVELYVYDEEGGCAGTDEPSYVPAWQCGECETVYLDKDEAKDCCKS